MPLYRRNVVGFEVLTAVIMRNSVFWDITPFSSLQFNQRSGEICRLHLQGTKIKQETSMEQVAGSDGFLRDLFFHPEDGSDMFL
jgi:hypothetical protein